MAKRNRKLTKKKMKLVREKKLHIYVRTPKKVKQVTKRKK